MTSAPPGRRGAFILLEGLDRSGKSTQCALLAQHLNAQQHAVTGEGAGPDSGAPHGDHDAEDDGPSCVLLRFPDRTTAVGGMIDAYLKKATELDDHAVHLLFAANSASLHTHLLRGRHVVVDRYAYSGAAFTAAKGLPLDWCFQCEVGLPAPDCTILLSISPADAAVRGGFGAERYETSDVQRRVREQFSALRAREERKGRVWREVEAGKGRTVEQIAAEIRAIAEETIARVRDRPMEFLQ